MAGVTCRAGEHGLYLYWDELPPFSKHSLPAFRIARQGDRLKVTGVKIRPSEAVVVEIDALAYEPDLPLAHYLPKEDNVAFGGGEPIGPEWDALSTWLEALGFDFLSHDDVQDVVRGVPVGLLAPFARAIADQRRVGQSLTASDRHCLLWSLSPGWEWLNPSAPSSHRRVGDMAENLRIPARAARRLAIFGLRSSLDSAPKPHEAGLLALGLYFVPLRYRFGRGAPIAGLAASLMRIWRESEFDPLVLWIRALEMGRTKRFSRLYSDLPIAGEELQAWLRSLLGVAQEQELDPVRALFLVAGWVSECNLEEVRDALREWEVRPIEVTESYIAETPLRSAVSVGALSAVPIVTAKSLRSHPCIGHFYSIEANVRCLLEGGAWYFDLTGDSGSRVLAVFREMDDFSPLTLVSADRTITNVDPWSPLIEVIRSVLDANPDVRGSVSYRAALKQRLPGPLPRAESLEDQLRWAEHQAIKLGAFEFIEAAIRIRDREAGALDAT
jgi:hypothetical protein